MASQLTSTYSSNSVANSWSEATELETRLIELDESDGDNDHDSSATECGSDSDGDGSDSDSSSMPPAKRKA